MLQRTQHSFAKVRPRRRANAEERALRKLLAPEGLKDYEKAKRVEAEKTVRLRNLRLAKEATLRNEPKKGD